MANYNVSGLITLAELAKSKEGSWCVYILKCSEIFPKLHKITLKTANIINNQQIVRCRVDDCSLAF